MTIVLTAMRGRLGAMAETLVRRGQFVPGVRPGRATEQYLDGILSRLTVLCGAYLVVLHLLPEVLIARMRWLVYVGGRSYLVVVWVALRMLRQASEPHEIRDGAEVAAARLELLVDARSQGPEGMR